MASGSDPNVRFVKCPKCFRVLIENPNVPVYQCGGCFTILQAKKQNINGTPSSAATERVEPSEGSTSSSPDTVVAGVDSIDTKLAGVGISNREKKPDDIRLSETSSDCDSKRNEEDSSRFESTEKIEDSPKAFPDEEEEEEEVEEDDYNPNRDSSTDKTLSAYDGSVSSPEPRNKYPNSSSAMKSDEEHRKRQPYYGKASSFISAYEHRRIPSYQSRDEFDIQMPPYGRGRHSGPVLWGPTSRPHIGNLTSFSSFPESQIGLEYHRRRRQAVAKRHVRPASGGAPLTVCYCCMETLQLPADFLVLKRKCHLLRCGSCSNILRFSLQDRTHLVPVITQRDTHGKSEERSSSARGSPLHRLMGYSTVSQVFKVSPRISET